MPVVIADDLVLSPQIQFDADNPVIGWKNFVTAANIDTGLVTTPGSIASLAHPTINMANPSTYLFFETDVPGISYFVSVLLDGTRDVDYVGIAGHNLGSGQRRLRVFGATQFASGGIPILSPLTQEVIVSDDSPLLFRFATDNYINIVVECLATKADASRIAVFYVGKLTVLERKIQVQFTPIKYGRKPEVTSNRSETGQFLGRLMVGRVVESQAHITHLTPAYYRDTLDAFIDASSTLPFFFAWAPQTYPYETGYAWMVNQPMPLIHDTIGLIEVTLDMQGIAA